MTGKSIFLISLSSWLTGQNNMKNYIITAIAALFGIVIFATPAFAATTASFAPASIQIVSGQQFVVIVSIDTNGTANYVDKIEINYPSTVLEMKSFTFANGWMPITQSGYDSVNTSDGVIVKTAGYPGGVTGKVVFGTAVFVAKKAGTGSIRIGNNSTAFESNTQKVITGPTAPVNVVAAFVAATPLVERTNSVLVEEKRATSSEVAPVETTVQPTSTIGTSQTAAVSNIIDPSNALLSGLLIVALLVILGLCFALLKKQPLRTTRSRK